MGPLIHFMAEQLNVGGLTFYPSLLFFFIRVSYLLYLLLPSHVSTVRYQLLYQPRLSAQLNLQSAQLHAAQPQIAMSLLARLYCSPSITQRRELCDTG